jgi:predicted phosphodiesterase
MPDYCPFSEDKREKIKEFIKANPDASVRGIASEFNISPSTAGYYKKAVCAPPDLDLIEESGVKKALEIQKLRDTQRCERKDFRDAARIASSFEGTIEELKTLVSATARPKSVYPTKQVGVRGALLIGLSDTHFGMTVDTPGNKVTTKVLSSRMKVFVEEAVEMGIRMNVDRVAFVMTGDLVSSDRRPSELATYDYNRAYAIKVAFDIISEAIDYVCSYLPVTHIIGVSGNETRLQLDLALEQKEFSNNMDWILLQMLSARFPEISFGDNGNVAERLVEIEGAKILLSHGIPCAKKTPEQQVAYYRARFGQVDHVITGHIHSPLVAANYSRSGALVGANVYSESILGIAHSVPSQTFHIVDRGVVRSFPVDLTRADSVEGFWFSPVPEVKPLAEMLERI